MDFYFDGLGYNALFKELWDSWPGGVAQGSGFIHIDSRDAVGEPRARWHY